MNWDKVSAELQKPLSPDAIKPPPQGKYGEYVDALHVIREANRIFGHDGWSYATDRLELTNSEQNGDKHRIGYFAIVTVTIDGVSRSDVGHGQGFGKSLGDAHDSAVKEAVTDALKRALRTFGNTFGLALYEKDKSAREVGYTATQQEIEAAMDAIQACEDMQALHGYWTNLAKNARHVAEDADVIEAKNVRKTQLTPQEKAA